MLLGTVAGGTIMYELVSWAATGELSRHVHGPANLLVATAAMVGLGLPAAMALPRTVCPFAFLTAAAAAAASGLAVSGDQHLYAVPLVSLAGASVVVGWASLRLGNRSRRPRTTV